MFLDINSESEIGFLFYEITFSFEIVENLPPHPHGVLFSADGAKLVGLDDNFQGDSVLDECIMFVKWIAKM